MDPRSNQHQLVETLTCFPCLAAFTAQLGCSQVSPFGMYPENRTSMIFCISLRRRVLLFQLFKSSPRLISIGQLNVLPRLHLRPINDIVYVEPYSIKDERSYLRESFTLRCLQRLSRPYVTTQLCPWQNNWCIRGMSIPVLSY